jgi:predicted nucleotidyltransferase
VAKDGVGIDIALAAIPFEERVIERSTRFEFLPGVNVRTCSAEDLIVYKAFADRSRDWVDIEGILARQGSALDVQLIETELTPLTAAKESPGILRRLKQMLGSR